MHSVDIEMFALRFSALALPAVTGYPTSYIYRHPFMGYNCVIITYTNHSLVSESSMHFLFAYVTLVEVILMS